MSLEHGTRRAGTSFRSGIKPATNLEGKKSPSACLPAGAASRVPNLTLPWWEREKRQRRPDSAAQPVRQTPQPTRSRCILPRHEPSLAAVTGTLVATGFAALFATGYTIRIEILAARYRSISLMKIGRFSCQREPF